MCESNSLFQGRGWRGRFMLLLLKGGESHLSKGGVARSIWMDSVGAFSLMRRPDVFDDRDLARGSRPARDERSACSGGASVPGAGGDVVWGEELRGDRRVRRCARTTGHKTSPSSDDSPRTSCEPTPSTNPSPAKCEGQTGTKNSSSNSLPICDSPAHRGGGGDVVRRNDETA